MKLGDLIDARSSKPTAAPSARNICTLPPPKRNAGSSSVSNPWQATRISQQKKKRFLSELTAAEGLERYLGAKFPGAKRFSLEGGDALVPMLKELIRHAGKSGTREVVLSCICTVGRLNVLVNVLEKSRGIWWSTNFCGKHKRPRHRARRAPHGLLVDIGNRGGQVQSWHWRLTRRTWKSSDPVVPFIGSVRARLDRLDEPSRLVLPINISTVMRRSRRGGFQGNP